MPCSRSTWGINQGSSWHTSGTISHRTAVSRLTILVNGIPIDNGSVSVRFVRRSEPVLSIFMYGKVCRLCVFVSVSNTETRSKKSGQSNLSTTPIATPSSTLWGDIHEGYPACPGEVTLRTRYHCYSCKNHCFDQTNQGRYGSKS